LGFQVEGAFVSNNKLLHLNVQVFTIPVDNSKQD
jgi:hypothetical protein